jgi:hypothetical protein
MWTGEIFLPPGGGSDSFGYNNLKWRGQVIYYSLFLPVERIRGKANF